MKLKVHTYLEHRFEENSYIEYKEESTQYIICFFYVNISSAVVSMYENSDFKIAKEIFHRSANMVFRI